MSTPNPPKGGNKNKKPGDEAKVPDVPSKHFIEEIVEEDNRTGRFQGRVQTRFPPEPNGYLHIGHAKSICLNFGLALKYGGKCNLRYDDTNPTKEETEYVDSIREDVRWLGFTWDDREFYASDYFEQLYDWAEELIRREGLRLRPDGGADSRASRHAHAAGQGEPYRNRPWRRPRSLPRMKAGEFPDGSRRAPKSTWRRPTSTCAIRSCTASCAEHHRTGNSGASTDVRLGSWRVRLDRKDHALDLHA